MFWRSACLTFLLAAALLVLPAIASAQGVGLGPRLSFVRGETAAQDGSTRFVGGILRLRSSRRVVLEAAADYRTERSEDGTSRVRERPLQGSLLLFPVRGVLAPYVLAGYGLYTRTTDTLDSTGATASSVSERRTGVHIGLGAEVFLGRHAAFVLDYRYRFVRFGRPESVDEEAVNLPGLGDRLSHRGSMWTSGVAFYF